MDDKELLDDLYRSEDLNFEGIFLKEMVGGWSPSRDINWNQEISVSAEKEEALAEAVTQYYYSNIAHLLLCGRLLEKMEDIRGQKLALFLAFSKIRNGEVYGRYLGKTNSEAEIAPYTREYFSKMSANRIDILLPDMGVLGGTLGYGTLKFLGNAGDPLFKEIADKVCEQKERNMNFLADYLNEIVQSADAEEYDNIRNQAIFYRERAEKIIRYHSELLETLEIEPDEVVDYVLELTDDFYRDIGLKLEEAQQAPPGI